LQTQLAQAEAIVDIQKKSVCAAGADQRRHRREVMMPQITDLARQVGVGRACAALGVPRSSYYRFLKPKTAAATDLAPPTRAPHPRALTADEQAAVRAELNSERFVDATPRTS
jgi:hypothetical protein